MHTLPLSFSLLACPIYQCNLLPLLDKRESRVLSRGWLAFYFDFFFLLRVGRFKIALHME
jgi:hypothetical protein